METEIILGQNHIIRHFENAIKMGKISHAYIINGEKGTGKLKLARQIAKTLQCTENNSEEPTGKACGQCKSCKQTESGNQPDIKYINYEKTGIGVDEIREQINDDIDIKPYSSRYKIYIIPDSEKMTVQAQNALLKTIEEPPAYGIIILLTTNADLFLQTILSRCVLLNMRPVREETVKKYLIDRYGVSSYDAGVAAIFSGGNIGKAVNLATEEDFKELKSQVIGTVMSLESGGMDVIAPKVKEAASFKKNIEEYLNLMRIWFRDVLLFKATGSTDRLIFQDDYQLIKDISSKITYEGVNFILKAINRAESRIKSNVNFDVTMEVLLLAIKERIK
jgi:DNA polymerase-3 subunit delta'